MIDAKRKREREREGMERERKKRGQKEAQSDLDSLLEEAITKECRWPLVTGKGNEINHLPESLG